MPTKCCIPLCGNGVYAKGLCDNHYRQQLMSTPEYVAAHPCSVEGCDRGARRNGMCQLHFVRWSKTGTTDKAVVTPDFKAALSAPRSELAALDSRRDERPGHAGFLAVNIVNDIKQKALVTGHGPGKYSRTAKREAGWWALTPVQAYRLIVAPCFYCGIEAGWPEKRNGIDRRDPAIGYTPENSVTACWRCNAAKNDQSDADFRAWVERLYFKFVKG